MIISPTFACRALLYSYVCASEGAQTTVVREAIACRWRRYSEHMGWPEQEAAVPECQAIRPPSQRLHSPRMDAIWQLLPRIHGSLASKSTLQMLFTSGRYMMWK